jgi:hypothetical protein
MEILEIHASTEDKIEDGTDSFYEKLGRMFDIFHEYHMKILLGDFYAKINGEDISKPKIWNENQ